MNIRRCHNPAQPMVCKRIVWWMTSSWLFQDGGHVYVLGAVEWAVCTGFTQKKRALHRKKGFTQKKGKKFFFLYSFSSSHGSKAHPHRHSLSDWLLRSWGPAQGYSPAPSSWVWRYSGPALQSFVRSGVCVGRGAGGHSVRRYRIRSDPGHSSFSQAENGNGTGEALWSRSPPPPIGRNHGSSSAYRWSLGGAWRGALHDAPRAVGGAVRHVFSCLLVQGVRLKKLAGGRRSPAGSSLAGLAFALTVVQGIIAGEWLLLTVVREGHAACDYLPLDFVLVCSYALALLLAASMLSLAVVLCGGNNREESSRKRMKWRCNALWLFLSCLSSLLLWVAWLGLYLYGEADITTVAKDWDEPALAVALVTEGWVLLLFHAIPETHLCLRPSSQRNADTGQNYYDTPQLPTTQSYHDDERPTNPRAPFAESQAYTVEEHSAGRMPHKTCARIVYGY